MTSLSHDVRTPMTTLIGYLDALDLKLVSSDKEEQYLRLAKEKAYDLKNISKCYSSGLGLIQMRNSWK